MDPLSITVSVSSLLMVAAKVVKSISDVRDRYKDAAFMLASIASEVAVIHASLAHLQNSMLADVQTLASRLTPQITSIFDTGLLGCALALSVLDDEVQGLVQGADLTEGVSAKKKMQYALDPDRLKELLTQIRGQQIAITLLLTTFQK
jgi:hypothetical protein